LVVIRVVKLARNWLRHRRYRRQAPTPFPVS
jgi:hypothetical protein